MKEKSEGLLLRIFISEADKHDGKPLYERIMLLAKEHNMAGATALKGFMGFGSKQHMHTTKLLRLTEDLPIVIEIVDAQKNVDEFIAKVNDIIDEGLMTLQKIDLFIYKKEL